MTFRFSSLALCAFVLLGACASKPPTVPVAQTTAQWQAPLPHGGQVAQLSSWWLQFNDPLLVDLQTAAQEVSSTLAQAQTRIALAQATQVDAARSTTPTLNWESSAVRGKNTVSQPVATNLASALQASWELDIFGGSRAARNAAQERVQISQAQWHEARVLVAAEVATLYVGLRSCEAQLLQTQLDSTSRSETARLTELSAKAGVQAPASAALARASAAQGHSQTVALQAQCDGSVKALVALSGLEEALLRERLKPRMAQIPKPAQLAVASVPAEVLNQRPDLFAAAREVVASSAQITQAQAARFPRITLNGSVGAARYSSAMVQTSGSTWSIGPVSIVLPILDAGVQKAQLRLAQANYFEAATVYRAKVRSAVREVEDALVQLQSLGVRQQDAGVSVEGFDASYRATLARFKGGLASLFELEDARRSAVQAQVASIDLQREQVNTWIALYRASGGGWNAADPAPVLSERPAL
jgi:outer membrane protein, multidrug efflux system